MSIFEGVMRSALGPAYVLTCSQARRSQGQPKGTHARRFKARARVNLWLLDSFCNLAALAVNLREFRGIV